MKRFSTDSDMSEFFAWLALIIAGVLLILTQVFGWLNVNLGVIGRILVFVRDLSFILGIGLAAYRYTHGRSKAVAVLFWVALIAYLVFAVLGIFL